MKKNPYTGLMDMAKRSYENDQKSLEFFFGHSDKLITWLIGFAVGGISLIVANSNYLVNTLPKNTRIIVLLLSLTIFFGLIYRLTVYFYLMKHKSLENYFSGYFGEDEITPVVAEDITNATIKEMLEHIEFDFEKTVDQSKADQQELNLEALKKYYLDLIEYSKRQFYIGAHSLSETYELAYKIKKDVSMDLLETAFGLKHSKGNTIGFHEKLWRRAVTYFFSATIISFLICTGWICVFFFIYK